MTRQLPVTFIPHAPSHPKPLAVALAPRNIQTVEKRRGNRLPSQTLFSCAKSQHLPRLFVGSLSDLRSSVRSTLLARGSPSKTTQTERELPRCVFHHHDNDGRPSCSPQSGTSQLPQRSARPRSHHNYRRGKWQSAAPAFRSRAPLCRSLVVPPPEAPQSHHVGEDSKRLGQGADARPGEHARPETTAAGPLCPRNRWLSQQQRLRCGVLGFVVELAPPN